MEESRRKKLIAKLNAIIFKINTVFQKDKESLKKNNFEYRRLEEHKRDCCRQIKDYENNIGIETDDIEKEARSYATKSLLKLFKRKAPTLPLIVDYEVLSTASAFWPHFIAANLVAGVALGIYYKILLDDHYHKLFDARKADLIATKREEMAKTDKEIKENRIRAKELESSIVFNGNLLRKLDKVTAQIEMGAKEEVLQKYRIVGALVGHTEGHSYQLHI